MACEQVFVGELRARRFRVTAPRQTVLSALHDVDGFVTAEQLHARVRRTSSAVDLATVYRTLDLLQKLDLVSSVDGADGQRRYELLGIHGPHMHLTCQACGRVIAADPGVARPFAERIEAEYGFRAAVDHLSVPGLCPDCAAGNVQSRSGGFSALPPD